MSLYKKQGSPYWQYDFTRNGRRYAGSTRRTTRREAEAVERKLKRDAERGLLAPASRETMGELLNAYWDRHARHQRAADTLSYYIQALSEKLDLGMTVDQFGNAEVADYIALRRTEVSAATVNREIATLRAAHTKAGELWEWPVRVIAWKQHRLKEAGSRERWIDQDTARKLIAALTGDNAAAAQWSFLTGCRKAETFGLEWQWVNLHNRTARVYGKGGKWRIVHLNAEAVALLANRPGEREGKVFRARNLRRDWQQACEATGLVDFRWHDMRHTWATWAQQAGVPVEARQRALGHASIATTQGYSHGAAGMLKAAFDAVSLNKIPNSDELADARG